MSLYLASLLIIWAWLSNNFWNLRYFWDWSGDVATVLVIVGVIGETFAEWTDEYARKYRTLAKLSAVVLIIGLAVELSAHRMATELTAEETSESDKQLDQTFKAAGSAIGRAADANERAGIAEQKAGEAKERASKNEQESTALRKQAAGLRKQAEDERLARVKIEQQLEWRSLSVEQKDELRIALLPFAGARIRVSHPMGDPESGGYAADFADVVLASKWLLDGNSVTASMYPGGAPTGLAIIARDKNALSGGALQHALMELGLDAPGEFNTTFSAQLEVELRVGIKPRPKMPNNQK